MTFNQYLKTYYGISLKEFFKSSPSAKDLLTTVYKHGGYKKLPQPVIEEKDVISDDSDWFDDFPDASDADYWMSYMAEMGYPVDEFTGEPIGW